MLVQLEDVAGEEEQANLPGTSDAHPNWRRRLSVRLEDLLAGPRIATCRGARQRGAQTRGVAVLAGGALLAANIRPAQRSG